MTDIELRNEDGKIVGYDTETNEKVPVSLEALETEEARTDSLYDTDIWAPAFAIEGDGSRSAPYRVDYNAALDAIPDGNPGKIIHPNAHHIAIEKILVKRGIRSRNYGSDKFGKWINPAFVAQNSSNQKYGATITLDDGVNDHLFEISHSSEMGDNHTVGGGIFGILLNGNKDNNSSGSIVKFSRANETGKHTQFNFWNVMMRWAPEHAIDDSEGLWSESTHYDLVTNRSDAAGAVLAPGSQRHQFVGCRFTFARNDSTGIEVGGNYNMFSGCWFRANDGIGLLVNGQKNTFGDCVVFENSFTSGTDLPQAFFRNQSNKFRGIVDADGNSSEGIKDDSQDNEYDAIIRNVNSSKFDVGAATRPRFQGVIGGGPMEGIDLTSTAGLDSGDRALSDGTATDFPFGTIATWQESSTQWVRADGQATQSV